MAPINVEQSAAIGERIVSVPVDQIDRSPYQVRVDFDDDELRVLADDNRRNGLNQPVTLRSKPDGRYELVAGERRWLAARLAGLDTVDARIRELDDFEAHLVGVSENNQRADLSPWERALETLELQTHAEAVNRPRTQRDLATYLNRNLATVNQQLAIARAISAEFISKANVRPVDVCRLTHETLHRIVRLGDRKRAKALHAAIRTRNAASNSVTNPSTTRNGATATSPSAEPSVDRWTRLWEHGGFQLHVRKPLREIDPVKARRYVEQLLPGIGALAVRAGEENRACAVVEWRHERGRLLFLRPADQLTAEQQREARDALAGMLADLGAAS
jgi:ParB/RepB/Spo0J family partition protein